MRKDLGFSLLELTIVLIIISIVGSYAVLKTRDTQVFRVRASAEQFQHHILHAQMLAMSWGQTLRLNVNNNSYFLSCVTPGASPCDSVPVIDPANGQPFIINFPSTVRSLDAGLIEFDALGRPLTSGAITGQNSVWRITNGSIQYSVSVSAITGSTQL